MSKIEFTWKGWIDERVRNNTYFTQVIDTPKPNNYLVKFEPQLHGKCIFVESKEEIK